MAFSPNEYHHPQLGEPTDARFWDSMVSVVYTGLEHMLSHYEPGGFPRIWTASAFPPSLWRHRMMVHGTVGKRSIVSWGNGLMPVNIKALAETMLTYHRWDPVTHDDVIKWKHFSALLAICAGNSPVPGEFPTQRPVTRSFDVYFDLRPNKRLSKQSWGWWFETLSCSLWRHRNESPYSKSTRSHTHQNTARHTMPLFRDPTLNNGYWFIFFRFDDDN